MKSARISSPRTLEFVETPLPDLSDIEGEPVLVRLHAGVLCASDFPRFLGGAFYVDFPRPLGDSLHECIGEVAESRSPRFKKGDLVLAIPPEQRGLSEYLVADASKTVHIPTDFHPREHLILGQPLGTVVWAARKLPNLMHKRVAVIGQGPIGLMFDHLLANMGARQVIALDKLDYRLEAARQMKATDTVNVDRDDPVEAVLALTGGQGVDIAVEAVGHQHETLHMAVDLCRPAGTVLMFGIPHEEEYPLPIWKIIRKNLTMIGTVHPEVQVDMPIAIEMITSGRIDVSPLITHRFPLAEAQEAFTLAVDRVDNPIKVLLETEAFKK